MSNQNELINSFNGIAEEMMRLKTQNAALVEALTKIKDDLTEIIDFAAYEPDKVDCLAQRSRYLAKATLEAVKGGV